MIYAKITNCRIGWDDFLRAALDTVSLTGVAVE